MTDNDGRRRATDDDGRRTATTDDDDEGRRTTDDGRRRTTYLLTFVIKTMRSHQARVTRKINVRRLLLTPGIGMGGNMDQYLFHPSPKLRLLLVF